jgi:tetratricopeptide (TPR) repeat protein
MVLEEAEVRRLLTLEPYEVAHHERYVRYAARTEDRELLIHGLQHMAMALRAAGLEWRAKSTLARILSMDPENQRALEALGYGTPGGASEPFLRAMVSDPAMRPVGPVSTAPQPAQAASRVVEDGEASPDGEELAAATAAAGVGNDHDQDQTEPEGGWVDLGAMIFDDREEHGTRWQVEHEEPEGDEDANFADILAQFKDKVSEHLERSDARAHYDLGAAYRGMGLQHEAIAMFQNALRAEPDFLPAIEILGRCFLENGEAAAAVAVLRRALDLEVPVEDDLLGVYYYLGNAYELLEDQAAAKDLYMKIFARDINFIDTTERLRALR